MDGWYVEAGSLLDRAVEVTSGSTDPSDAKTFGWKKNSWFSGLLCVKQPMREQICVGEPAYVWGGAGFGWGYEVTVRPAGARGKVWVLRYVTIMREGEIFPYLE